MWFVYLLECADTSFYCGITTDLTRRLRQHNEEIVGGARYTRHRQPVQLVYSESYDSRSEASQREYQIKRLSRQAKIKLITHAG